MARIKPAKSNNEFDRLKRVKLSSDNDNSIYNSVDDEFLSDSSSDYVSDASTVRAKKSQKSKAKKGKKL